MTVEDPGPSRPRSSALRRGAVMLALTLGVTAFTDPGIETGLRVAWFDSCQRLLPRERTGDPVVIVEIDEKSLTQLGQWPWPRTRLAGLIDAIAEAAPAVIAVDALFPEPDRYSPNILSLQLGLAPAETTRLVETIPDSDARFARAVADAPVVLGFAGVAEDTVVVPSIPSPPIVQHGGDARAFVRRYPALLGNLPTLDAAARGHGALNAEPERGIVRRIPTLVGSEAGHLLPGLAVEVLRALAVGSPLEVWLDADGMRRLRVADIDIDTEPDGSWWLHFSRWEERPAYSAADILRGNFDPGHLRGRIVLVGYTALGLRDTITTPLGRMPGVEAHAEAIENALAARLLVRDRAVSLMEAGLLGALGLLAIALLARASPRRASLTWLAACGAVVGFGVFAFQAWGWLIDVATPLVGAAAVFGVTLAGALSDAQAQRRVLHRELAVTREAQARLQGELDAARRIQLGMLPDPSGAAPDPRVDLAGAMVSAKTVGGDLYDFFPLDADRLFLLIGDVSGKGLPGALFMALAKAQFRGAAWRADGDPGETLTAANRALAADNPEFLFITVFAAELDLVSGRLRWSNAGHDSPFVRVDGRVTAPFHAAGPPLCAIDDYAYATSVAALPAAGLLCLFTDGVTEAHDAQNALFGAPRLDACLHETAAGDSAREVLQRIERAVAAFVGTTEQHDDITLLCVRRVDAGMT